MDELMPLARQVPAGVRVAVAAPASLGGRGNHRCDCGMEICAGRGLDRWRAGLSDLDLDGSWPNEPGADSGTRYPRGQDRVDDRRDDGVRTSTHPLWPLADSSASGS
jgi:hypothetical protein